MVCVCLRECVCVCVKGKRNGVSGKVRECETVGERAEGGRGRKRFLFLSLAVGGSRTRMTTVMKLKIMTTMGRIVQVLIVPSSSTPRPLNTKGGFVVLFRPFSPVAQKRLTMTGRRSQKDRPRLISLPSSDCRPSFRGGRVRTFVLDAIECSKKKSAKKRWSMLIGAVRSAAARWMDAYFSLSISKSLERVGFV